MTNWHCIVTDNEPKHYLRAVKVSTTLRIVLSQVIFVLDGIFWPIKTLIPSVTVGSNFGWWSPSEILALYSYPGRRGVQHLSRDPPPDVIEDDIMEMLKSLESETIVVLNWFFRVNEMKPNDVNVIY